MRFVSNLGKILEFLDKEELNLFCLKYNLYRIGESLVTKEEEVLYTRKES